MSESIETRLRAVEFLLVDLISRTKSPEEIRADHKELKEIAEGGHAWRLMPELTRDQAKDVIETAIGLLDDALFQAHSE